MTTSHEPRTDTLSSLKWLGTLLHTTDSAYPIGGFAHSGGLEGMVAVDHIRNAEDLRRFMNREIADTLAGIDLPLLHQAMLAATADDDGLLLLLDETSEAVRFTAEQRLASRRLGLQRWSLIGSLQGRNLSRSQQECLSRLNSALVHKHLCIVAGIEAALLQLPVTAAMIAYCHQSVMMVAQAAMKIMRVGQTSVQGLVVEMAVRYPELISHAKALDLDEVGACLPLFDIAACGHESAHARMFLS